MTELYAAPHVIAAAASTEFDRKTHQRWMLLLGSLSDAQLGRAFRHPQRGLMAIDNAIQLYAWHGIHHTAHITHFRARQGW